MDAKNRIVDRSRVLVPAGTMEDFKRPDHPDFMTASELKAIKFSGLRRNEMGLCSEVWMLGEAVITISDEELRRNPKAINIAMEDVFALERVMPDTEAVRDADRLLGKA